MKENQNIAILGSRICLVPYRSYHVLKYHEWMSDDEVRKLTASEPLTLEEEYEMQKKWATDSDKCTFIVLEKLESEKNKNLDDFSKETLKSLDAMIGDVNLFFDLDPDTGSRTRKAELEVMIADRISRRRGFGKEATSLMLLYGAKSLNVSRFSVKIGFENEPSLRLFKSLGFFHESYSEVFKEFTLVLDMDDNAINALENRYNFCEINFDE